MRIFSRKEGYPSSDESREVDALEAQLKSKAPLWGLISSMLSKPKAIIPIAFVAIGVMLCNIITPNNLTLCTTVLDWLRLMLPSA